jgi:hypothetical protein
MNRALRRAYLLWGRRLGIPLLKKLRRPGFRRLIRGTQKALIPQLAPDRRPPDQVISLRDYVRQRPETALPIPTEKNPAQEIAVSLTHARIVGESGQVCLPDLLLSDVSFEWFMEPQELSLLYRFRLPPVQPLSGTGTSVAVISGHCYYHWLFNSLPRLGLLEAAGCALTDLDFVITNPLRHPFQRESLQMLGIHPRQIRETHPGTTYLAERMLLTTIPNWIRNFHHSFLRNRLAPPPLPNLPGRRIYLGRQGSRHRHVTNEEEVVQALAQTGVEVCHPENLSFIEQIRLFQSASVVVAPHGAALANIVFCQPKTRVAEIFSAHYFNDCYQTLARETGLIHHSLAAKPDVPLISDHHYVEEPITVDVPYLLRQLNQLGVS